MRKIIVTQRENLFKNEMRDSIDIRWSFFLEKCNLFPILIPNNLNLIRKYLNNEEYSGILLTGGGLIASLGEKSSRDEIEKLLISKSISDNIPLIGVCRGMQQIQSYFKIKLKKVEGHVNKKFEIDYQKNKRIINSFHEYGTEDTINEIKVTSRSTDNIVKSISHRKHKIMGIMWHPERNRPFDHFDIELFGKFYL
jgi:putative glutamine amidotransferase|tara:strand:- start:682 stop:1269 length:588 start_codon:yes stop_codon:yes gene_type:complete